jgi:hypothetical protein
MKDDFFTENSQLKYNWPPRKFGKTEIINGHRYYNPTSIPTNT